MLRHPSWHGLVPCSEGTPRASSEPESPSPPTFAQLGRRARLRTGVLNCDSRSSITSDSAADNRSLRGRLGHIVRSNYFDWGVCLLICLNAISLGIQTDHMARSLVQTVPEPFRAIETSFCVLFTCELLARLYVHRVRFFIGPGWQWNLIDAGAILLQVVEEILALVDTTQSDGYVLQGASISRLVRMVRAIRVVRIVRIVHLIRELRLLVVSIANSFRPFFWTAMLLLITIFMLSLSITHLVADLRISTGDVGETVEELTRYYGSLYRSMLSLFESITGGMDWDALVQPLAQAGFSITQAAFLLYVAFSIFAIMNVVAGLFIESMLRHAKAENDIHLIHSVQDIFMNMESGIHGTLSWKDFEAKMQTPQMRRIFKDMDINESDARGIFCLMDLDGSGAINLDEFLCGCLKLRSPAKAIDTAVLIQELLRLTRATDD